MKGGNISFSMDSVPDKAWAAAAVSSPTTVISDNPIVTVPYVVADSKAFTKSTTIELKAAKTDDQIFYTLDGADPQSSGTLYDKPFTIEKTTHLKFCSLEKGVGKSFVIDADFFKVPEGRSIKIKSIPGSQYTAGGPTALIDGIRGDDNFRLGAWQGYQGQDFEAVVDLGKIENIHKLGAGFLQDVRSWIWMPTDAEFATSMDGIDFTVAGTMKNTVSDKDYTPSIKDFTLNVDLKCRYVRVKARNYGTIPSWHLGAGGEAYIFIDEIIIE